jgi:hypothetical protein
LSKHVIKLNGEGARGAKASSALLRDLLDVLVEATRSTIRLRAEGRSSVSGPDPDWLVEAADFEILGFEAGSTDVVCEARSVGDVAPDAFAQQNMFSAVDTSKSGLGLLEQALGDIQDRNLDSDLFDDKILNTLCGFRKVFGHGIDSIGFDGDAGVKVVPDDIENYSELRRSIPRPERVRVAGLLDSLTATRRAFQLKLSDGTTIRGRFEEDAREQFQELWNQQVLVTGQAEFKPSGFVRHIQAERIEPATERHQIWSEQPRASQTEFDTREFRRSQEHKEGLAALVGQWPGDETDEQIDAELRKLS